MTPAACKAVVFCRSYNKILAPVGLASSIGIDLLKNIFGNKHEATLLLE